MARADRDAILVALIQELGELPPHFDLERFALEVERWKRQGKGTKEIARLVLAQCDACTPKQPRRPRDGFFTVQAHHQSGGLFRTVEHVLAAEIAQVKRRLERESSSRLVFTLLSEGTKPRSVQGSFDFQPTPAKSAEPDEADSLWATPAELAKRRRPAQQTDFAGYAPKPTPAKSAEPDEESLWATPAELAKRRRPTQTDFVGYKKK
jgi:hypothetical protein